MNRPTVRGPASAAVGAGSSGRGFGGRAPRLGSGSASTSAARLRASRLRPRLRRRRSARSAARPLVPRRFRLPRQAPGFGARLAGSGAGRVGGRSASVVVWASGVAWASSSVMATALLHRLVARSGVSGSSRTGAGRQVLELAQARDDALQVVAALAGHADGVPLDLRLDLRELVADQAGDPLGDLVRRARDAGRSAGGPCCRRLPRPCPSRRS